jgi:DNA polymerase I-like protein with 3'-5' exonuclease and polymerase domains
MRGVVEELVRCEMEHALELDVPLEVETRSAANWKGPK